MAQGTSYLIDHVLGFMMNRSKCKSIKILQTVLSDHEIQLETSNRWIWESNQTQQGFAF